MELKNYVKVTVLKTVKHDGETFREGDTFVVGSDRDLEILVSSINRDFNGWVYIQKI